MLSSRPGCSKPCPTWPWALRLLMLHLIQLQRFDQEIFIESSQLLVSLVRIVMLEYEEVFYFKKKCSQIAASFQSHPQAGISAIVMVRVQGEEGRLHPGTLYWDKHTKGRCPRLVSWDLSHLGSLRYWGTLPQSQTAIATRIRHHQRPWRWKRNAKRSTVLPKHCFHHNFWLQFPRKCRISES